MFHTKTVLAAALCAAMPIATTLAVAQPAAPAPAAPAAPAGAQPLGSAWGDVTRMPDFFTGNWQSVTSFLDKANGTPLTPQAKAHADKFKAIEDIPFAGAGCKTPGMPIIQRLGSPLKFFYEPGMIAIYIENSSMTRFLRLNGKHSDRPNPSYLGESVAHFEGDTLVVDSISFHDDVLTQYTNFPGKGTGRLVLPPDSIFGPHGPDMRMVERFRLLDPDTMEIRLTIYDDTIWTKPYEADPQIFKRNRGEAGWPAEWVCGTADDPVNFDPNANATVMEDPEAVLKKLKENEANK
ncbi:hypothetical protein [Novosphingobium sp. SG720]|uniref:hypothetical protein n=1 Tax=Novosphingobium sp. SG720 TaxID=2586998 RepID=UPI001445E5D6|nr:hypothetical protein [Novosphingobium sp. SG720]NKJ42208.1 hypothetical protein [Novosphingobium sp. SG720]